MVETCRCLCNRFRRVSRNRQFRLGKPLKQLGLPQLERLVHLNVAHYRGGQAACASAATRSSRSLPKLAEVLVLPVAERQDGVLQLVQARRGGARELVEKRPDAVGRIPFPTCACKNRA